MDESPIPMNLRLSLELLRQMRSAGLQCCRTIFSYHCLQDWFPSCLVGHFAIVALRSDDVNSVVNKTTKSYVTFSTYMFCSGSAAGVVPAPVGPV